MGRRSARYSKSFIGESYRVWGMSSSGAASTSAADQTVQDLAGAARVR